MAMYPTAVSTFATDTSSAGMEADRTGQPTWMPKRTLLNVTPFFLTRGVYTLGPNIKIRPVLANLYLSPYVTDSKVFPCAITNRFVPGILHEIPHSEVKILEYLHTVDGVTDAWWLIYI